MPSKDTAKTKLAPKSFSRALWALGIVCLLTLLAAQKIATIDSGQDCGFRQDMVISSPSNKDIGVEIAADGQSQIKGLSGRPCLPDDAAMLFSFNSSDYHSFWMKDMNFALGFVWVNSDKMVVGITENVTPDTYPQTYTSPLPAQYVFEFSAGDAKDLGIEKGTQLNF